MADNDKEREAFLIKIGQVKPAENTPKAASKKEEE